MSTSMINIEELLKSSAGQRKSWAGPERVSSFEGVDDGPHSFSEREPLRSQEFLPTVMNDGYGYPEESIDIYETDTDSIMSDRPNSSALWDEKTVLSLG